MVIVRQLTSSLAAKNESSWQGSALQNDFYAHQNFVSKKVLMLQSNIQSNTQQNTTGDGGAFVSVHSVVSAVSA